MNNTYFNKDIFPQNQYNQEIQQQMINQNYTTNIQEQPYIENILKFNKGKKIKIYTSFPNKEDMKEFKGILENSGKDYITISDPQTGNWNLIPIIFMNYITFDENINYSTDFFSNNWFK